LFFLLSCRLLAVANHLGSYHGSFQHGLQINCLSTGLSTFANTGIVKRFSINNWRYRPTEIDKVNYD